MWMLDSRRAGEPLAEFSDTACFVPCKHCSELLQEDDRFCRFCGVDQLDAVGGGAAQVHPRAPQRSSVRHPAEAPAEADFADTLQPDEPPAFIHRTTMLAANEAGELTIVTDSEPGFLAPQGMLEGSARRRGARRSTTAILAVGISFLMVLLVLLSTREPGPEESAGTDTRPVQRVAPEPIARAAPLRAPVEQPAQASTGDALQEPASKVFTALGLGEPPAAAAPAAMPAETPVLQSAQPTSAGAGPTPDGCSETLAALAMCPHP